MIDNFDLSFPDILDDVDPDLLPTSPFSIQSPSYSEDAHFKTVPPRETADSNAQRPGIEDLISTEKIKLPNGSSPSFLNADLEAELNESVKPAESYAEEPKAIKNTTSTIEPQRFLVPRVDEEGASNSNKSYTSKADLFSTCEDLR